VFGQTQSNARVALEITSSIFSYSFRTWVKLVN